jgi:hypothetical protein
MADYSFRQPRRLQWRGDALLLDGKGRPIVQLMPDGCLWRVELPDGRLSDRANRVRIKDAGLAIACQLLSQRDAA